MMRHVRLRALEGGTVVLAGGILGLEEDGPEVARFLSQDLSNGILLGIPFEDLDAIKGTSGKEQATEFDRDEADEIYLQALKKFGPVKVPPTDLYAAYAHAEAARVPIEAIALGDEGHSTVYTEHVGMFELMRNNRRLRDLKQAAFEARTPMEFAREWDEHLFPTKGLRRVQQEREAWMAQRVASLATPDRRLFALVPLARWEGVVDRLVGSHRFVRVEGEPIAAPGSSPTNGPAPNR
jgi:hypothetical protein